jgi:hypothetical protein
MNLVRYFHDPASSRLGLGAFFGLGAFVGI